MKFQISFKIKTFIALITVKLPFFMNTEMDNIFKKKNQKIISPSFSTLNSKTFLFLLFLSKHLSKSALNSLKWGFLILKWNLVLPRFRLPYSVMALSFPRYFRNFHFKCRKTDFKAAEIALKLQKLCRKYYFRIRKSRTKFHFKGKLF